MKELTGRTELGCEFQNLEAAIEITREPNIVPVLFRCVTHQESECQLMKSISYCMMSEHGTAIGRLMKMYNSTSTTVRQILK